MDEALWRGARLDGASSSLTLVALWIDVMGACEDGVQMHAAEEYHHWEGEGEREHNR